MCCLHRLAIDQSKLAHLRQANYVATAKTESAKAFDPRMSNDDSATNGQTPIDEEAILDTFIAPLAMKLRVLVKRRYETISFVDHQVVTRKVRLDLDFSSLGAIENHGEIRLPLAFLSRKHHHPIDLRDANGSSIPMLVFDEEREAIVNSIADMSSSEGLTLSHSQIASLKEVLKREPSGAALDEQFYKDAGLTADLGRLVHDLRDSYLLIGVFPSDGGKRRVVTFEYVEECVAVSKSAGNWPRILWRRISGLFTSIGQERFEIDVVNSADCESFHLAVDAPPDTEIHDFVLPYKSRGGHSTETHVKKDPDALRSRGHIQLKLNGYKAEAANLQIRLAPRGVARTSVFSVCTVLVTILFGAIRVTRNPCHVWEADPSASASVLLIIPAIAGGVLAIRSPHRLTTRLLFHTRLLVVAPSAALFMMAMLVATRWEGRSFMILWWTASVITLLSVIALMLQQFRLSSNKNDA
jgi:hypothetical protein